MKDEYASKKKKKKLKRKKVSDAPLHIRQPLPELAELWGKEI